MSPPASSYNEQTIGRRDNSRVRLNLPGDFVLLNGRRHCRISNLSVSGARVALASPPQLDTEGFLRFAGQERFVHVVWSSAEYCGVAFDVPLPYDLLLEMRILAQHLPVIERAQQEQAIRDWVDGRGRIVSGHA